MTNAKDLLSFFNSGQVLRSYTWERAQRKSYVTLLMTAKKPFFSHSIFINTKGRNRILFLSNLLAGYIYSRRHTPNAREQLPRWTVCGSPVLLHDTLAVTAYIWKFMVCGCFYDCILSFPMCGTYICMYISGGDCLTVRTVCGKKLMRQRYHKDWKNAVVQIYRNICEEEISIWTEEIKKNLP